jgi:tetratricopeptide (TPR) repeat protein
MRELLAAGFPVLVENSYYEGNNFYADWLSHNRVLIGYNDSLQTFYFQDPLLGFPQGQIIEFSYEDFDTRWKPFNRDYMVFYTDDETEKLQAVLGQQWDDTYNAEWTLQQAQAEIDSGEREGLRYSYYNRGWAQVQLGEYEAAAASFDVALADDNLNTVGTRLPRRFLWYDFSVFEAYLQVERYDDVLNLARQQIGLAGDSISVEEWYYYAARAYEAQGNLERAQLNYEVALFRNRNFEAAQQRLEALGTGSG